MAVPVSQLFGKQPVVREEAGDVFDRSQNFVAAALYLGSIRHLMLEIANRGGGGRGKREGGEGEGGGEERKRQEWRGENKHFKDTAARLVVFDTQGHDLLGLAW